MTYDWINVFNLTEFEALDLGSKTYTFFIEGVGEKDFLVTKGNLVSVTYEGVMVSLNLNLKNPFEFSNMAIYLDEDSQDVWVGINGES